MELRAWPVIKPHYSDLIASPLVAGVLQELKYGLGYKPFL
jgi:hypothetical protein